MNPVIHGKQGNSRVEGCPLVLMTAGWPIGFGEKQGTDVCVSGEGSSWNGESLR